MLRLIGVSSETAAGHMSLCVKMSILPRQNYQDHMAECILSYRDSLGTEHTNARSKWEKEGKKNAISQYCH